MRTGVLALVVLALAFPALADNGPLVARAKGEVVGFLALTADQTAQWDALLATREQAVAPLRTQLQGIEDQLQALLAQTGPDPAAVGNLVLQAHGVRAQIKAADAAYTDGFAALLTPNQEAKLGFLRRAAQAQPLLPAFHFFGLVPPAHDWRP